MKLIQEGDRQRVYQSEVDPEAFYDIRLEVRGFFRVIERATYESHDPADRQRVETVFTALRRELAIHFADLEEVDLVGVPTRNIGTHADVEAEPGLFVPAVMLTLEQAYWPPAPEEES